ARQAVAQPAQPGRRAARARRADARPPADVGSRRLPGPAQRPRVVPPARAARRRLPERLRPGRNPVMTPAPIRARRRMLGRGGRLPYVAAVLACLVAGAPADPAAGQEAETLGTEGSLTLEVRKGRVIRLPHPAATVFVADPEIADVQAQSASIV